MCREGSTDKGHGVPLTQEALADLASVHHLVCDRGQWAMRVGEYHKGIQARIVVTYHHEATKYMGFML